MKLANLLGIMNSDEKVKVMHHTARDVAFKEIFKGEIWEARDEFKYKDLEVIEAFIDERKEMVIYTK